MPQNKFWLAATCACILAVIFSIAGIATQGKID
jgi:hypothetical protein